MTNIKDALEHARMFIENGVELGYIRLPDSPDPALATLPKIKAALSQLTASPDREKVARIPHAEVDQIVADLMRANYSDKPRLALAIGRAIVAANERAIAPDEAAGALSDISAERQRQREIEGWTLGHDDAHVSGELAMAGACYALASFLNTEHALNTTFARYWPWDREWWKPKNDPRRNLIKAGALIVAEIERLDRAAAIRSQEAGR